MVAISWFWDIHPIKLAITIMIIVIGLYSNRVFYTWKNCNVVLWAVYVGVYTLIQSNYSHSFANCISLYCIQKCCTTDNGTFLLFCAFYCPQKTHRSKSLLWHASWQTYEKIGKQTIDCHFTTQHTHYEC